MADDETGLFAIEVDADNYAETAAGDTPSVSRTHQSEADFKAQKASYTAKIDGGNSHRDLLKAVPVLDSNASSEMNGNSGLSNGHSKLRLSKKDVQLLSYAVGELYFDGEYAKVLRLCERVEVVCEYDERTGEGLRRWRERCRARLAD